MSSQSLPARKPRLGGRSARVREAVLAAAFAELDEHGYRGFNIESVARRSGVHKTTIYRRWPTREALLVYALDSRATAIRPCRPLDRSARTCGSSERWSWRS